MSDTKDVLLLPDDGGFVIGKLFHRHGYPQQISTLEGSEWESIRETAGKRLIDRYWGNYVAAISTDDGICVIRDPSGGLSCYYCSSESITAFASDGPILVDANIISPSVDWDAVGRTLYLYQLPPESTAVSGMNQILPGCAVVVAATTLRKCEYWSPWKYVQPIQHSEDISEQLSRVVRSTHAAWVSCYPNPLVGLSGGLDSSIVAACLAAANGKVSCVNLVAPDPIGDERAYARELCRFIGVELIEAPYLYDAIDLDRSVSEGVPIPVGKIHEHAYNRAIREAADHLGNDSFFVGAGGDNVFYLTHSARPLVDRYMTEGWSLGLINTLHDVCAITGASAWQVLREVRRLARNRGPRLQWSVATHYLNPDFIKSERSRAIEHPWLHPSDETPLGKIGHVAMILRAMNHIEHRDKSLSVPMISSLLSQPVVELCLSIPSWQACEGGVDRAVARQAFADALPRKVVGRYGKGSPDGFVSQFINRYRPTITERLLDGELARHSLVDRPALERVLRSDAPLGPNDCPRIMALLDTEAWVRHWSRRTLNAGATISTLAATRV